MPFHPDSIAKMQPWKVVDAEGRDVLTEEAIRATAHLERGRPCDIARREARRMSDPISGPCYPARA